MANRAQKGLGGAAQGAAAGSTFGPWGAVAGGVGGLFAGILGGDDQAPPSMYSDQEIQRLKQYSMANPDFNISLAKENPELYRQLMKNDVLYQDMTAALNERRQGATAQEQRSVQDYMNNQGAGMASSGMAGTPMGNAMMADSYARANDPIFDRIFKEKQAMQAQLGQQGNANTSQLMQGQGQVLAQQNANRQAALSQLGLAQGNQQDQWAYNQGNQFDLGGSLLGAAQAYQGFQNADAYRNMMGPNKDMYATPQGRDYMSMSNGQEFGSQAPQMAPQAQSYSGVPSYGMGLGVPQFGQYQTPQLNMGNYSAPRSPMYHQGVAPPNAHFQGRGPQ